MSDDQLARMQNDQIKGLIERMTHCVDRVGEIHSQLAVISERLVTHFEKMENFDARLEKLTSRTTSLEGWLYKGMGFMAAVMLSFELYKVLK
jgi:chromosome segregation ATPase